MPRRTELGGRLRGTKASSLTSDRLGKPRPTLRQWTCGLDAGDLSAPGPAPADACPACSPRVRSCDSFATPSAFNTVVVEVALVPLFIQGDMWWKLCFVLLSVTGCQPRA